MGLASPSFRHKPPATGLSAPPPHRPPPSTVAGGKAAVLPIASNSWVRPSSSGLPPVPSHCGGRKRSAMILLALQGGKTASVVRGFTVCPVSPFEEEQGDYRAPTALHAPTAAFYNPRRAGGEYCPRPPAAVPAHVGDRMIPARSLSLFGFSRFRFLRLRVPVGEAAPGLSARA